VPSIHDLERDLRERPVTWRERRRRRRNMPPFAAFGPGSTLGWPRTATAPDRIRIGAGVHFGDYVWFAIETLRGVQVTQGPLDEHEAFDPQLVIGDRCRFGRDVTFACLGHMTIGSDVFASDRVLIADTYHDYRDPDVAIAVQPMIDPVAVTIGDGAYLGTGVIVNRASVGAGAVIAPGSVVTSDIPDHAFAAGAPARVVSSYAER